MTTKVVVLLLAVSALFILYLRFQEVMESIRAGFQRWICSSLEKFTIFNVALPAKCDIISSVKNREMKLSRKPRRRK